MTIGAAPNDNGHDLASASQERAALEGMLKGYPVDHLVEEILVAWDELAHRNEELVDAKQRLRVVELDLADRRDSVAPELIRLQETEKQLQDADAQIVHLKRLLDDSQEELKAQQSSMTLEEREALAKEAADLRELTQQQDEIIGEMEGRMMQMVGALERAANAGLTSVTADDVRAMKSQLDEKGRELDAERAANEALEEERQRLRDIADRMRGLLDARDRRLAELEEQLERVMQGPRSVSAEHDYLVEQIEELKRRLLERNREYESLRRRERRLHNDVFERDERLQQITLTLTDLESALQDRTAELRELEDQRMVIANELESAKRGERTREIVGRAFADSLALVRGHESRELKRKMYAETPDKERTIKAPKTDDMAKLAGGETIELEKDEKDLKKGKEVDTDAIPSPGGTGEPVVFEGD
jgi:chromosome segregation ATPase